MLSSRIEVAWKLSSSGSPQASSKSLPFAFNFPRSHAWACARPGRPDVRYRVLCLQDRRFVSLLGVFVFAMHSCLLCLLSLTYLKHLQASCGHVVACGCTSTFLACEASAETRLVPSSGKSSQMSTALTQPVPCATVITAVLSACLILTVSFRGLKSKSSSEMSFGVHVACFHQYFATLDPLWSWSKNCH